jgi:hypothetical protein
VLVATKSISLNSRKPFFLNGSYKNAILQQTAGRVMIAGRDAHDIALAALRASCNGDIRMVVSSDNFCSHFPASFAEVMAGLNPLPP